ncbi:MAG: F0F1 ATP synthase subunit gamma [Candidatus Omnitrophica bacterium]|nr:F0F1 ATP synthase subunit gamma [Candidatus Omnitrophota bacterium]
MGGKVTRIKGDLDDVEALLEIINILKDVSTNRFFAFVQQKADFTKFLEIFLYFFERLENIDTQCPLIRNDHPARDILVVTSDAGFMSALNSRVCNATFKECQEVGSARIACVGKKGADKCVQLGLKVDRLFEGMDDRYTSALKVRDYLVERVMTGETGGCRVVYIWPKSFNILKPRVVKLLPATELLSNDEEGSVPVARGNKGLDFIQESTIDSIMKILADLWVCARLFEILTDTKLSEAATQAQQLEAAVESLGAEKKALMVSFKKASRDELNSAMREVFTSSSVIKTMKGKR